MKQRCENTNNWQYKDYGLRGIEVRFRDAKDLVDHIGLPPPGYVIDRIDNDGHYERDNVRWTDQATSLANRRGWAGNRARNFTTDEVESIVALWRAGVKQTKIAAMFLCDVRRINAIVKGWNFSWLTGITPRKKAV